MCLNLNIVDLETPLNTEKYYAPKTDDESPFYITEYGKTYLNTPCYQLRMKSYVSCLQYVIAGSGIIICNNNIYTVQSGDTFLLPEGSDQIYYSNTDNQFERIWINFKGEFSREILRIYGISDSVVFKNTNTYDLLTEIQEKCKSISNPVEYKNESSRIFLKIVQFLSNKKTKEACLTTP